jgi:phosphohistidine phosphatase
MPRLLLLRHAKAEQARSGEGDHERRLAERGRDDSAVIGGILRDRGEAPDLVLCSTSARTRETWAIVSGHLTNPPEPSFLRELYEAGDYLAILQREGGDAKAILLIGHNPTAHDAALRLAGGLDGDDGVALGQHFPTAALAILDVETGWDKLAAGTGSLIAFIRPRAREAG